MSKLIKSHFERMQKGAVVILCAFLMVSGWGRSESLEDNDDEQTLFGGSIIGKWKLVKVTIPFVGEINDYSKYNIVYEFREVLKTLCSFCAFFFV